MRKLMTTVAGSVAVAWLFSAPASAQYVYGPPPIAFAQAQPITGPIPGQIDELLYKPPVRTPIGTIGNFLRTELHDGMRLVGIVTLKDYNKTIAVPLEHLRFDPASGQVLTDLTWSEMASMPSGRRLRDSRCYPYGCPTAG